MKYRKIVSLTCLVCVLGTWTACGPKIDLLENQIIENPDNSGGKEDEPGVTTEDVPTENLEGQLMSGLSLIISFDTHSFQYQRSNSINTFSGYFSVSNSDFQYGGALPYIYYYPNPYFGGPLGGAKNLLPYLYHAYHYAANENHNLPEWKAIAQIAYGYSMQELVDIYGTVPYHDFRHLKETPPLNYINGHECYKLILDDLAEAIQTLKDRRPSAALLQRIEGNEGGYSDGKWEKWVKFANSIRLRMAMNMVNANPEWAQEIAEKVVIDPIGILLEGDGDFILPDNGQTEHPLYSIGMTWNDERLGGALENIMKRYENPLIRRWFNKNSAAVRSKEGGVIMLSSDKDYVGIRQGVPLYPNSGNTSGYGTFSSFSYKYMPRTYYKVVENLFHLSEAALRKWSVGGTAKEFYERGIRHSFKEHGFEAEVETYLGKAEAKKVDYVDYYVPEYSCEGRVNVGVQWKEGTDREILLEQIITQKYMANFPQSAEAWTTFRRTGYPRLFPVPENYKWTYDDSFDAETQIRRIPYANQTSNDALEIPHIEQALEAPNQAGTQVWWDTTDWKVRDERGWPVPNNFQLTPV